MSQLKLINEFFVRPNCEIESSKRRYDLSPIDLSLLSLDYIQYGLLFTEPPDFSSPLFVEKLRHSLSTSLSNFYPLSGRLATTIYEDQHSCCIYVDCNAGPGARFIHASALDLKCSDIILTSNDVPYFVRSFFDLGERAINHDGHTRSLLSIQVTEISDGTFLGLSINHSIADGTSFNHFLISFSELVMGSSGISGKPVYNYRPPNCSTFGPTVTLPHLEPREFITRVDEVELRERVFHFSSISITELKKTANKTVDSSNTSTQSSGKKISSFQALTALIWKSITRARNLGSTEKTTCTLLTNLRQRFKPPLSQNYFGVFATPTTKTVEVNQLLTGSLCWIATLLNEEVAAQDNNRANKVFSRAFAEGPKMILPGFNSDGPNPVVMMGSARFDLYGLDFGLGRAVAIRSGIGNKADGLVRAFTGSEGVGSVELQVCLSPQTMRALLSDKMFMSFVSC